ncbi:MAG: ATP-dependent DNA helicase RecG [Bacteroidetes bacterium]|nr:MAG: ATP-dependent DNA helicase RecG [Bacteroidota bacterium]
MPIPRPVKKPDVSHLDFLSGSVQFVKGIGPRRAEVLSEAGVKTVRDLLNYFPRKYLDRTSVSAIKDIHADSGPVTIIGTILTSKVIPGRRGRRFELVIEDEPGRRITCVWFKGVAWVSKVFETDQLVAFHGRPQKYSGGLSLPHPDFDVLDEEAPALATGRIIALYPGGASLSGVGLTSRSFRRTLFHLIKEHGECLQEVLPESIQRKYNLMDGRVALRAVHFPKNESELLHAIARLKFEELFFIQLMLARMKRDQTVEEGVVLKTKDGLAIRFIEDVLPFELTGSQIEAIADITTDTASGTRMNRLLQGDVGSGKTVVAVAAMLHAVDNNLQAVFMAPTEILAEQHYRNLLTYFDPLGIPVRLLLGGMKKSERSLILEGLASGTLPIVVGTHAVIQKDVLFKGLGMCIVDEQHRFGVMQRATLFEKGDRPHTLLMTATPIPRSLALTVYGDLDVSIMRDQPPGRPPIKTQLIWDRDRDEALKVLRSECGRGRQAYVVYPLVEESEKLDLKDAESGYEGLVEEFPEMKVDLIHGRMSSEQKDSVMMRFVGGDTHILVSTTVIEVGVDVPNATVMMIEHAERFGLSQLHQLRGRVGRGEHKSTCILIAHFKRSAEADERLRTMVETNDGFEISEVDLKLRGAGDFFGTRQSGLPDLKIADIVADTEILIQAREAAFRLAEGDPDLIGPENESLGEYFRAFYGREVANLSRVG